MCLCVFAESFHGSGRWIVDDCALSDGPPRYIYARTVPGVAILAPASGGGGAHERVAVTMLVTRERQRASYRARSEGVYAQGGHRVARFPPRALSRATCVPGDVAPSVCRSLLFLLALSAGGRPPVKQ